MRRMLLHLTFSHLGADLATSEAWEDNWPSRRVNEKCGYLVVGQYEKSRVDGTATMMKYELTRRRWTGGSLDLPEIGVEIDPRLPVVLG
jgi:RimJ/RimL family protein N-acetyltransferase